MIPSDSTGQPEQASGFLISEDARLSILCSKSYVSTVKNVCNTCSFARTASGVEQEDLYRRASGEYGSALERLVRAYEADPDKRRDLLQEIHLALWQSFEKFEDRCSLRTWVYRVAHNTAVSHIVSERRAKSRNLVGLEELEAAHDSSDHAVETEQRRQPGPLYDT